MREGAVHFLATYFAMTKIRYSQFKASTRTHKEVPVTFGISRGCSIMGRRKWPWHWDWKHPPWM